MRLLASKFLATSLLSAALAIAAAGTASAAGATWTSFDTKRLSTLLKTMGAQSIEVKRATEGKVTVEAVLFNSGDTRYMAMPTVCRANGCLGLSLTVYWTNELKLTADIVNAPELVDLVERVDDVGGRRRTWPRTSPISSAMPGSS